METPKMLSTNRTLLRITPLAPLRDLKIECFPGCEAQTLEQLQSMPAYYLMDMPKELGYQKPIRERAESKISATIFEQELAELAIPVAKWPDTHNYDQFKRYFKVEHLALTADLGVEPLVTKEWLDDA